jgi:hypothetical protein
MRHLNQTDTLSSLFLDFALEYAIWKAQEDRVGLKLNGAHQLLVYSDDVSLSGANINTLRKNTVNSN